MSNKLIDNINKLEEMIIIELTQKEEEIYMLKLIINENNINFKKMDKIIFDRQQYYLNLLEENNKLKNENNNMQTNFKILVTMFLFINSVYFLNTVFL